LTPSWQEDNLAIDIGRRVAALEQKAGFGHDSMLRAPSAELARFLARSTPEKLRQDVQMGEADFAEVLEAIREHVPGYGIE